jgi:hypothetical protein
METDKILKKDVTLWVEPEKMVKAFHANTIMARILKKLEENGSKSREGWTNLMDWTEEANRLASLLPDNWEAVSAKDNKLTNPFSGIKQRFNGGFKHKEISIFECIKAMHNSCLGRLGNEHLNLLEIMEDCRLVQPEDVKSFCLEFLGQDKTPKENMEEFILEMEGSCLLKETTKKELEGKNFYSNNPASYKLKIDEDNLYVQTSDGVSTFKLYKNKGHIVVIQKRDMEGTSITNLAEVIRDFLHQELGDDNHIYEAYETDAVNGKFNNVEQILGKRGQEAQWLPITAERIPGFKDYIL